MVSIAVMLSIPIVVIVSLIAIWMALIDNNIYVQVGLVLIFGIAAETAILIVKFANRKSQEGGEYSQRISLCRKNKVQSCDYRQL